MRWSIPKLALMLVIALGITASALHASTTTINSTLAAQNQPVTVQLPYYAELTYTDIINQTSSISLQPSQSSTVQAPPLSPPGQVTH